MTTRPLLAPTSDVPPAPTAPSRDQSAARHGASPHRGRRAVLVPISASDIEWLRMLLTSEGVGFRHELRGHTPSPAEFDRVLWEGVLAQFMVASGASRSWCGGSGWPGRAGLWR